MKKKVLKPNVVRGGTAVPLGANYYYMAGRKHKNGGIDIGKNPRTGLEVEGGEVMHIGKNEVKVFSSVPFLNGKSPAQKVMGGENPNKVFKAQEEYKDKHNINDDGTKKNKTNKNKMGGLSRNKDYGSKSKPYPSVKSKDFAGSGRSYPIPTKADAVDALRLAGLHGRSDVKAKVYRKYPELRKKSAAGGLYSVTINGKAKWMMHPSTGEWGNRYDKTSRTKKVGGGPKGINPDLYEEKDDYKYNPSLSPFVNDELRREHIESNKKDTIGRNFNFTNRTSSTDTANNTPSIDNTDKKDKRKDDNSTSKFRKYINDNPETISDAIGLSSNIIGGLVSHKMNRDMLNKLKYNSEPIARIAAKLKTRININPQLDKMRETLAAYERNVDSSTASSRVALARKQRARLANMLSTNELYGNKENMETELINKDKLNQQSVTDANIRDYNSWRERKAAFDNAVLEKKVENDVSLINTINTGIQDTINRAEKRKSERQTRLAMMAANPNVNPRILKDIGIKGISNKDIEAYDKVYGKKKKDRKSSK